MKFGKITKLGMLLSVPMLCLSLLSEEAKAEDYIYGDLMEKQSLALEDLTDSIKEKYNVDDNSVYDKIDELGFIYFEGETLYFVVEDKNINQKYSLRADAMDFENSNVEIITSKTIQPSELKNVLEEINQWISEDPDAVNVSSTIIPNKMKIEIEYNTLSEDVIKEIKQTYAEFVSFKLVENKIVNYKTTFDDGHKWGDTLSINNNYATTAITYKKVDDFLLEEEHSVNALNATQYQNNALIGVNYPKADYVKLDAGLMKITPAALSGGRYVTNSINEKFFRGKF